MFTDLTHLKKSAAGDMGKIKSYIELFTASILPLVNDLKAARKNTDWNGVKQAAHSMKPIVAFMGIGEIKQDLQEIEDIARNKKDTPRLKQLVSKVEKTCLSSITELEEYLNHNAG